MVPGIVGTCTALITAETDRTVLAEWGVMHARQCRANRAAQSGLQAASQNLLQCLQPCLVRLRR